MKRFILLYLWGMFLSCPLFSQAVYPGNRSGIINQVTNMVPGTGEVQIIQNKKIDDLLARYIDTNAKKGTVTGYKLFIFSESTQIVAHKHALEAQAKFLKYFPDVDTNVQYDAPDWKVYVGNFRSRSDALRLKKQIETLFPKVFLVQRQIDYTKL